MVLPFGVPSCGVEYRDSALEDRGIGIVWCFYVNVLGGVFDKSWEVVGLRRCIKD
jgi:hypothetical protein